MRSRISSARGQSPLSHSSGHANTDRVSHFGLIGPALTARVVYIFRTNRVHQLAGDPSKLQVTGFAETSSTSTSGSFNRSVLGQEI